MNGINHDVVLFVIDPGAKSGFAIGHQSAPVVYGDARRAVDRAKMVAAAVALHADTGDPIVVVMEKWAAVVTFEMRNGVKTQRPISPATYIGMGDARGRWREHLELIGLPESRLVYVHTRTWQGKLLGKQSKSAEMKARTKAYVEARFGIRLDSEDATDALGILAWAFNSAEVAEVAAKRMVAKPHDDRLFTGR